MNVQQPQESDLRQQMFDAIIDVAVARFHEDREKVVKDVSEGEDGETFNAILDAAVVVAERYADTVRRETKAKIFKTLYTETASDALRSLEQDALKSTRSSDRTEH